MVSQSKKTDLIQNIANYLNPVVNLQLTYIPRLVCIFLWRASAVASLFICKDQKKKAAISFH